MRKLTKAERKACDEDCKALRDEVIRRVEKMVRRWGLDWREVVELVGAPCSGGPGGEGIDELANEIVERGKIKYDVLKRIQGVGRKLDTWVTKVWRNVNGGKGKDRFVNVARDVREESPEDGYRRWLERMAKTVGVKIEDVDEYLEFASND